MNLFNRKLILPVDVMITIAINIVVVVLGSSYSATISSWCGIYMDADWTGERS
jgi:hypothetical protein